MASSPPKAVLDLSEAEKEEEEENYHSASDEDFDPTTAPTYDDVHAISSSDDEGEATAPKASSSSKRKHLAEQNRSDLDFSNSGDEGIIKKGRRRAKKCGGQAHDDEDEGGEGGLIKTRAQRKVECVSSLSRTGYVRDGIRLIKSKQDRWRGSHWPQQLPLQ
jgi:hypothetical protein